MKTEQRCKEWVYSQGLFRSCNGLFYKDGFCRNIHTEYDLEPITPVRYFVYDTALDRRKQISYFENYVKAWLKASPQKSAILTGQFSCNYFDLPHDRILTLRNRYNKRITYNRLLLLWVMKDTIDAIPQQRLESIEVIEDRPDNYGRDWANKNHAECLYLRND